MLDERTWRTGSDNPSDWARRANSAGSVTAWRSYEQAGHDRWLWIQTTPTADDADALAGLSQLPARLLPNLRASGRTLTEREVSPPKPLTHETAWAMEHTTAGERGESQSLLLAWAAGRTVIVLGGSGVGSAWAWADLADLAQQQSLRLSA